MKENTQPKYALLIVDMQNAFFNNDALKQKQMALTSCVNELIILARSHSLPIFNIKTEHQKDIATWTLNMISDKQGYLFKGDDDSQNIPDLLIGDSIELIKTRDSAFHGTILPSMLHSHKITKLILCGVSTHTCIFQTASDAYAANFRILLAKEAIASHQPQYHKTALDILRIEYRQAALTNVELKQYIQDNSQ